MSSQIEMVDRRFGHLLVLSKEGTFKGHVRWRCLCDCGKESIVDAGNLRSRHTTSCGRCFSFVKYDEETTECRLVNGKSFIFDSADLGKVSLHSWSVDADGYVCTTIGGKNIRLHRFLLGEPNCRVDHINGNRSDNRRANLRLVTNMQNIWNSKLSKSNSTGYKGVSWDKRRHRYSAGINPKGKHIFLGYFNNSEDAAKAYDKAAFFYFGQYARPNFKEEKTDGKILELGRCTA